ncbi:hypothetical protein RIF25_12295 [Thermosynechococcaceae cyanobacterium BACA0444]|uniref:Uncharacterized protein n=1 Tax=Pseudocalidococcus azoricus BACA0444 TaxID=2918990 RepID=A0AAE4FT01_9CYAN|nr:hypothetical protein [Pseudocalidococcus azoricus]MDS3861586.1 hypothetical protein [Pseudocalidococcus azoricus BACA0444]
MQQVNQRFSWRWPLTQRGTLVLGTALLGLGLWETDPILLTATLSGIGTLLLVHRRHPAIPAVLNQAWQVSHSLWRLSQHHPLFLAGVLASGATLGTYTALKLWQDSPSPWIGLGLGVQGLGVLGIFWILITLNQRQTEQNSQTQWQTLLTDLADPQALKRYLAIRQLPSLATDPQRINIFQEALLLLIPHEPEPKVKEAALQALIQFTDYSGLAPESHVSPALPTAATPRIDKLPVRKTESQWV